MNNVYFKGLGKFLPEKILTNKDLEKMVDTSDKWITSRTGIKERRIADKDTATSDMGYKAAKEAIDSAGLKSSDIDMIIVATITSDMFFPSTACLIQDKLNLDPITCFDIGAACAGYIYAISIAELYLKAGRYKNILVVGSEKLSAITNWEDRNTCVLFGDGAGACVLSVTEKDQGILATTLKSDGSYGDLLNIPAGGSRLPVTYEVIDKKLHYLKMQGKELFKIAVKRMSQAVRDVVKKGGYSLDDISCIVPHQANNRIISAVGRELGLPSSRFFINIGKYGNMSSASTAVALTEAVEEGAVKKNDLIVMVAFGGGLVWGANLIKW